MVVPPSQCKTWIFLLHNGRCYALPMVRFFYIFVLLSGFTWSAFLPFVLFQVHVLVLRCHRQDTLRFRQLCQDVLDILQSQIVPQSHRILQDTLHQSHQMIFLMMNLSQVMNQVRIQMMVQNPLLGRHTHHQHHAHLPCQHTHLPHQPIHQPHRVHPNTQRFRTQIHQISLHLLHVKLNA